MTSDPVNDGEHTILGPIQERDDTAAVKSVFCSCCRVASIPIGPKIKSARTKDPLHTRTHTDTHTTE